MINLLKSFFAIFVLFIYGYLLIIGIRGEALSENQSYVLAMSSALVSAIVIAELAINTDNIPTFKSLEFNTSDTEKNVLKLITACYLLSWVVLGGLAFWKVYMVSKTTIVDPTTLTIAKSYIGLVIGALYGHFGLTRQEAV